jgi:hypothetical protein
VIRKWVEQKARFDGGSSGRVDPPLLLRACCARGKPVTSCGIKCVLAAGTPSGECDVWVAAEQYVFFVF